MKMLRRIRNKYKICMLVKTIVSKAGVVHFKRWSIIETKWFNIYVHKIMAADKDEHMHDHPWSFFSVILWGGYIEKSAGEPVPVRTKRGFLHAAYREMNTPHMIERLLAPVTWSVVLTGTDRDTWGYHTEDGWVDKDTYRARKRARKQ